MATSKNSPETATVVETTVTETVKASESELVTSKALEDMYYKLVQIIENGHKQAAGEIKTLKQAISALQGSKESSPQSAAFLYALAALPEDKQSEVMEALGNLAKHARDAKDETKKVKPKHVQREAHRTADRILGGLGVETQDMASYTAGELWLVLGAAGLLGGSIALRADKAWTKFKTRRAAKKAAAAMDGTAPTVVEVKPTLL